MAFLDIIISAPILAFQLEYICIVYTASIQNKHK